MPVFFNGSPGRVVALQDPAVPGNVKSVTVDDFGGFDTMKAFITRVTVAKRGNYQFLHSLNNVIHLYTFGDRMGQLTISGLAAASVCKDNGNSIGIEKVDQYYERNKISARERPLVITLGAGTSFSAYLSDYRADVADPQNRIYQFDMSLQLLPNFKKK